MKDNTPLAVSYYTNGASFRMSAEKLMNGLELDDSGRPTNVTCLPLYFLASHAAELFLKSALLKRGFPEENLKKFDYRHNLSALLKEIQNRGVPVTNETVAVVEGLSDQHLVHLLRYINLFAEGKNIYWPPLPVLFAALDELLLLTRISTHGI